MAVFGIQTNELLHSNALAWMLSPFRPHGFGDGFVRGLSDRLWPDNPIPDGPIAVERERDDVVGGGTRADILVWVGETLIVIENKVLSPEGRRQCENLYAAWKQSPDVRFVLLSRTGALPVTASSDEARAAWKSISYRQVVDLLDDLLETRPPSEKLVESTVRQYVATVRRYLA